MICRCIGATDFAGQRRAHRFRTERVGHESADVGQDPQSLPQNGQQIDRQTAGHVDARERHSDPAAAQRRRSSLGTGPHPRRSRHRLPRRPRLLSPTHLHHHTGRRW